MKRFALGFLRFSVVIALASIAGRARAQEGPGLLPDAPDGQPAPDGATSGPALDPDRVRARFGFDIAGAALVGRGAGPAASVRVGVQLNRALGLQVQTQMGVFAGRDFGVYSNNAIMGSLVLLDMIELAAGPSLDVRAASLDLDQGAFAGLATRVGFLVGKNTHRDAKRSGLSLVFHAHPTFITTESGATVTRTLFAFGIGGEWY